MPLSLYKLIHLLGIFCVVAGVAGMCFHAAAGGRKEDGGVRKTAGLLHGIGLFIVLLGGFGMLARLGASVLSGWVLVKLLIWFVIGGAIAFPYRQPKNAIAVAFSVIVLATLAGFLGIYKPF